MCSDRVLNSEYRSLTEILSVTDKTTLVRAEKEWLAYKQSICQGVYDSTYPGEEAGIDRWTCEDHITRARIEEIRYLGTGVGSLGFYQALKIIPEIRSGYSQEELISALADAFAKNDDKRWHSYVEDNCKIATSRMHEDRSTCIARQMFYKY